MSDMVNIFIDHPTDSRQSYVVSVAEEFTHPMLDFLDKELPCAWRLSSDCWCKEICNPKS
jgi:hypothetical protein